MQAHDQDELRRAAQKVLTRRIAMEQGKRNQPQREPERPRQRERPPEPEFDPTTLEAGPSLIEMAESPIVSEEPMARTERRTTNSQPAAPRTKRPAYVPMASRRGNTYRALHSRSSLRQAIVLSEILGPPKALREQDDTGPFGA